MKSCVWLATISICTTPPPPGRREFPRAGKKLIFSVICRPTLGVDFGLGQNFDSTPPTFFAQIRNWLGMLFGELGGLLGKFSELLRELDELLGELGKLLREFGELMYQLGALMRELGKLMRELASSCKSWANLCEN